MIGEKVRNGDNTTIHNKRESLWFREHFILKFRPNFAYNSLYGRKHATIQEIAYIMLMIFCTEMICGIFGTQNTSSSEK
jgi:hypothetical protein